MRTPVCALDDPDVGARGAHRGGLGDPEVEQLGDAVERHHDVRRRDVAVDDPERAALGVGGVVRVLEPVGDRGDHPGGERERHALLAALVEHRQDPLEIDPVHVLHRDEEVVAHLAEVVDRGDVRVVEPGAQPRLVEEHLHERHVAREVRKDPLDHALLGEAVRPRLARDEHVRHAARGEVLEQ
jgi:hypothetical protein